MRFMEDMEQVFCYITDRSSASSFDSQLANLLKGYTVTG